MTRICPVALLFAVLATHAPAHAQTGQLAAQPVAVPIVRSVPDPVDTPYPGGTIGLDIDATDHLRGIFRVTQTIPLAPGVTRLGLLLPQWLPGHHAPRGTLAELVDLRFEAGGKALAWTRDPVEVYAFHVDVPAGAKTITARFIHTAPLQSDEGRITMTAEMLNLQWEKMSLYPAGHYVRRIRVRPSVTLPRGWTAAAALDGAAVLGNRMTWAETDYETLVDSPIFAGMHFRKWDLGNAVTLSAVADDAGNLAITQENLAKLSALTDEAILALGRPPWDRYEYLVALSDRIGGIGLEHLRSSENQLEPDNFTRWAEHDWHRNVLPHELAHSWNGKFRRPARLWTPDYRQPMQDNLLWVYEGQTQFWGLVLAARSGVQSKEIVLGMMATQAGKYAEQAGRGWRSVEDTTHEKIIGARKAKPYASLARDEDYYNESALIWLEADQIIRQGTGGRKGLDDFARAFFGNPGLGQRHITYEFEDVVAGLSAVHRHDWSSFLRTRMQTPGQPAPLAGIEAAGYRLVWKEEPNPYLRALMANARNLSLIHSLGFTIERDGTIGNSQWGSPAFNAGVVNGAKLMAVNGIAYDAEVISKAITAAKTGDKPIELLIRRGDRFLTVPVNYRGGLRWPWLERRDPGGAQARLDLLLAPRRAKAAN